MILGLQTAAPPYEGMAHDGVGIWLVARRLQQSWPSVEHGSEVELDVEQLQLKIGRQETGLRNRVTEIKSPVFYLFGLTLTNPKKGTVPIRP